MWNYGEITDVVDLMDDEDSGGEVRPRREPAVLADVARCPICRMPLQARVGRRGPYMHCLCSTRVTEPAGRSAS
jgi:hypothetical protein